MKVREGGMVVFVAEQISHCPSARDKERRALRPLNRGSLIEMVRGTIMLKTTSVRFATLIQNFIVKVRFLL
jgi:hypothetical protein